MGSSPLNIGSFEDVQDWAEDLGDLGLDSEPRPRAPASSPQYEVGNLAALEEDSLGRRSSSGPEPAASSPSASRPPRVVPGPASSRAAAAPRAAKKSAGMAVVLLVLVVTIALVLSGAYFVGVIP